jgi:Mlc titration factor MtfA (ptsG expression regulator)
MADTPANDRIDMRASADVERWTTRLGISREALAKVIDLVGNRAADVEAYIRNEGLPAANDG